MGRGGLERVVCDLGQVQLRDGHQVGVVCLFTDGLLADEARRVGVPVVSVGKTPGIDLTALMRLRRAIKTCDADVIHTHNATAHYYAAVVSGRKGQSVLVNTRLLDEVLASDCFHLQWEGLQQSLRYAGRPLNDWLRIESFQQSSFAWFRTGFTSMPSARVTGVTPDGAWIFPKMHW